jgi:hypothetical protein
VAHPVAGQVGTMMTTTKARPQAVAGHQGMTMTMMGTSGRHADQEMTMMMATPSPVGVARLVMMTMGKRRVPARPTGPRNPLTV